MTWTDQQWVDRSQQRSHHLVTCWVEGVPAGSHELEEQGRSVEIVLFGLVERFFGRGLGGWLLTEALQRALSLEGVDRVWLHTCSLDGPAALANYQARGLRIFDTTTEWRDLG